MAFPQDIDPVGAVSPSATLNDANHTDLHSNILDRVFKIQTFLGVNPGGEPAGTMRERLKTAEANIVSLTASVTNQAPPPGMIAAWGGSSAPAGWHLCDGSTHGSSALKAVLAQVVGGGVASDRTPDLRDRFILGGKPGTLGTTGGRTQVTLTAAQSGLRQHNHGAWSDPANTDHLHHFGTGWMNHNASHGHGAWTGGGGSHVHQVRLLEGSTAAGDGSGIDSGANEGWNNYSPNGETVGGQGAHDHPVGVGGTDTNHTHNGWTDGTDRASAQSHAHGVGVHNQGPWDAAAAVDLMNPYYALVYIIKK